MFEIANLAPRISCWIPSQDNLRQNWIVIQQFQSNQRAFFLYEVHLFLYVGLNQIWSEYKMYILKYDVIVVVWLVVATYGQKDYWKQGITHKKKNLQKKA